MAIDNIEFKNCRPDSSGAEYDNTAYVKVAGVIFPRFPRILLNKDEPPVECGLQELMCKDKKRCIQEWERCDGKPDCNGGTHEENCPRVHGDCHFDNDWPELCDWKTKELLQFEWSRANKSRSGETGPPSSHNAAGFFLYMDSSKADEGDRAGVQTPVFKPNDGNSHLRFWYYMHGSTSMGTLVVLSEGEDGQSFPVFMKKGPQGQQWNYAHNVIGNDQHFRVTFMGIRGGDDKTDIAIDDVTFTEGCKKGGQPPRPTGPPTLCFKDDFICRTGKQCIPSNWRCDCAYDCKDGSDEDNCDIKCISTSPPKFLSTTPQIQSTTTTPVPTTSKRTRGTGPTTTGTSPPTTVPSCPEKTWRCDDGSACVPQLMLCDGVEDCKDGSDEKYKCKDSNLCTEMKYFCMDRKKDPCLPREKICNGKRECFDGSDESLCDKCPPKFCRNGGECIIVNRVPVCKCKDDYTQNRCITKRVVPEKEKEEKPKLPTKGAGIEWIIGVVIGAILLISIMFVIWYKRNTNAERARLPHAVDNPVYGLNLDTLTFGELNSHMPVRTEDGAGSTAIENPLYAFKSEMK